MSDFDAARKRLEEYASHPEWANDLGQLPILLTDILLLLAEVERLRAALAQSEKTSERIARVVGAGPALRGEGAK